MRYVAALAVLASSVLLGCAYPRTIRVYDEECQVTAKRMVLDVKDTYSSKGCANDECIAELVGGMVVLATSTVISGSIVVAGNVVYWLEKKRNCNPKRTHQEPASAVNSAEQTATQ